MQRVLALLLLSVVGFWPLAPAIASVDSSSNLPACCRAHGKHKCQMRFDGSSTQHRTPSLYTSCALYPLSQLVSYAPVGSFVFLPVVRLSFNPPVRHQVAAAQTDARLTFSFERSGQKRGPPSFNA